MPNKLFKVYLVVARLKEKKEFLSFFAYLFGGNPTKTIYYGDFVLAVFSNRKEAEKYMNDENNLPFDFKPKDCRVQDWKVDYQLYWKEWNKLEKEEEK